MSLSFTPLRALAIASLLAVGLPAVAQTQPAPATPPAYGAPITLEQAKKAMVAAEAEARKNNWQVVISIVDTGGHLVMLQRLEAQNASVDIATGKARTSVNFRRPSKALEDGLAKFDTLVDVGGEGANHWYHVTLKEGRNREVRRLWEAVGLKVSRLIRVRYGMVTLPRGLRPGRWQEMDPKTAKQLLKLVNMEVEVVEPAAPRGRAPLAGSAHATRKAAATRRISRPPRTARLPARTAKQAKRKE